jgi:hypothetical protein
MRCCFGAQQASALEFNGCITLLPDRALEGLSRHRRRASSRAYSADEIIAKFTRYTALNCGKAVFEE